MGKTVQAYGFPRRIPANEAKEFFERYTGRWTVVALDMKEPKNGQRTHAIVQFISEAAAQKIITLANCGLYYGSSYLKVRDAVDLIQFPGPHSQEIEGVTLNFGCQISTNRFAVLWSSMNISARFHTGLKKMNFFLHDGSDEIMLQLSYGSIWQVLLYTPYSCSQKLVVQLFGAPKIFKKARVDSLYSFFLHIPDDQCVRTTDFTPSSYIGQSSGLCLEFPFGIELPHFKANFISFREKEEELYLEKAASFSQNLLLVPIIHPPRGVVLPYKVLFKICRLVQTGCLPGPKLNANFFNLVNPLYFDITYIEHALEKLYYIGECCYDPAPWLEKQYETYRMGRERPSSPRISLDDGLVYVHRVQVTPTRVYFDGPEVSVSNRVLRHFKEHIDNFLRVSFVDEEWEKLSSTTLSPRIGKVNERTMVYQRIISILRNGIQIGEKKFDFLAFSSSQLRDNSLWMFAPTMGLNADKTRCWMGDFSTIRNVAKYAARLGQSFGSSTETLTVDASEVQNAPDIEVWTNGKKYVFSDGIGKISADFAHRVAVKCGTDFIPSAFQIRYGGYKGVVAVDARSNVKLSLRPSMKKYESTNSKLDVLAWSKYQACFLNRQVITLLSTLGVRDYVFEEKQREAVAQLDDLLVDPVKAEEALDLMSPGENTNILKELLKCGYRPDEEPFLSMMLQAFRSSKLLDLRTKARMFIRKGRQMMGCLDEYRILEYGQVFVQVSGARQQQFLDESYRLHGDDRVIIRGKVVVAKNPCLHPGDVRVLQAIDAPVLHHMVDCVVFPQKGHRPHPNECSGSDLDGDIYFVCWDHELIPSSQYPPMDYDPAPTAEVDHNVTIEEVEEYFTNYIVNDSLGIIANAHTAFADKAPEMAKSTQCLKLAELFSIAVDFPKTGVPAEIPSDLRVREYPDFMEKFDKTTYESTRVIGKLFRDVKNIDTTGASRKTFTREVARRSYDPDMEVPGFEDYIDEAFGCKTDYDYKLGNLMEYYGIKSEAEILSGAIMKMSKTFDRRKDAEAVGAAVKSLRKEAKSWFKLGLESENQYAKASAWYHVTYHPDYWGCYNEGMKRDHYISFPWCVYDKLIKIKQDRARSRYLGSLGLSMANLNL